jgi:acyl-CoA reductase-like NAD-dependent aldehyde dehydrogenase
MPDWPKRLYIDGAWVDGRMRRTWTVTNPATGAVLAEVAIADPEDVDRAVRAARRAFDDGPWPRSDPLVRGRMLFQLAERIRTRLEDFAMTDTLNVGKPIRDTRGFDVPCAADLFESYAGLPDKIAGKCYGTLPDNVTMQFGSRGSGARVHQLEGRTVFAGDGENTMAGVEPIAELTRLRWEPGVAGAESSKPQRSA